ncbi:hypothetical protein [Mucilaginibacter sp.]|uniref:hypothetical protein n=1 Tax=Mucilaginibacter sp. TaxID=1882438 RepID=UPI003266FE26
MKRLRKLTVPQLQAIIKSKQPDKPKIELGSPVLIAFWVFCVLCFFYSIFNIRDVLINNIIPLALGAVCGLIGILFAKKRENYFFAFLGYGSLVVAIPIFINNAFTDTSTIDIKLNIIQKNERQGRHPSSVDVRYNDFNRSFNVGNDGEMKKANYLVLKVSRGRLGYLIIRDSKLTR